MIVRVHMRGFVCVHCVCVCTGERDRERGEGAREEGRSVHL